jgi:hypothetical protein
MAVITARARVHRGREQELGRHRDRALRAADRDEAVLERLAHGLERIAAELRQLVEEQHAEMRERDFTGPHVGAAAEQTRGRARVVRRAQRSRFGTRQREARRGVHLQDREALGRRRRWQDARHPAQQGTLAGAGWADEQQVVLSGSRDAQRAFRRRIAADVAELGARFRAARARRFRDRQRSPAREPEHRIRQRRSTVQRQVVDERADRRVLGTTQHRARPLLARGQRHADRAARRQDVPAQAHFAEREQARAPFRRKQPRGSRERQRERQVEAAAVLPQRGRGEVDRRHAARRRQIEREERLQHAVVGLAYARVDETEQPRRAVAGVSRRRLDLHGNRVDAEHEAAADGDRGILHGALCRDSGNGCTESCSSLTSRARRRQTRGGRARRRHAARPRA